MVEVTARLIVLVCEVCCRMTTNQVGVFEKVVKVTTVVHKLFCRMPPGH